MFPKRPFLPRFQAFGLAVVLAVFNTAALKAQPPGCGSLPIHTGSAPEIHQATADEALKVVTLNMARNTRHEEILADIQDSPQLENADVWLLQEAADPAESSGRTVSALAAVLGMHYVYAPADVLNEGKLLSGLGIMSRYPIEQPRMIQLLKHDLKFNTRCRIALEATIQSPAGAVRIYNVHLDTRINKGQRLEQIRPVLESSATWNGPAVIGGDFNTVNVRWIGNLFPLPFVQNHADSLRDMFRQNGFESPLDGTGGTLNVLGLSFRLDWIFPKGLQPLAAGVADVDFSDHEAPWVELSWSSHTATVH